jgi:hypothetical protein
MRWFRIQVDYGISAEGAEGERPIEIAIVHTAEIKRTGGNWEIARGRCFRKRNRPLRIQVWDCQPIFQVDQEYRVQFIELPRV